MAAERSREQIWAAQWVSAGPALARVRAEELAALTPAQALAASDALLAIGATTPLPASRRTWSGLIDLQRWLARAR